MNLTQLGFPEIEYNTLLAHNCITGNIIISGASEYF